MQPSPSIFVGRTAPPDQAVGNKIQGASFPFSQTLESRLKLHKLSLTDSPLLFFFPTVTGKLTTTGGG